MKLRKSTFGLKILAGTLTAANTSCKKGCTDPTATNYDADASDGSLVTFLNGFVGTSSTDAFNTNTLGSWFTAVNYIGAVQTSSNWTAT